MSVEVFIIAGLIVWVMAQMLRIKYLKNQRESEVSWHARTMGNLAELEKEKDFILQSWADDIGRQGRWLCYNGQMITPTHLRKKDQNSDPEWPELLGEIKTGK